MTERAQRPAGRLAGLGIKASFVSTVARASRPPKHSGKQGLYNLTFAQGINCLNKTLVRKPANYSRKLLLNQGSHRTHYKNRRTPGLGTKAAPFPVTEEKHSRKQEQRHGNPTVFELWNTINLNQILGRSHSWRLKWWESQCVLPS